MAREGFPKAVMSAQHPKLGMSQTTEGSPSQTGPLPCLSPLSIAKVCGFHLRDPFIPSLSHACHCRPLPSSPTLTTTYTLIPSSSKELPSDTNLTTVLKLSCGSPLPGIDRGLHGLAGPGPSPLQPLIAPSSFLPLPSLSLHATSGPLQRLFPFCLANAYPASDSFLPIPSRDPLIPPNPDSATRPGGPGQVAHSAAQA